MNDAKSMLMMYSYAAMKANKPTEDKATNKDTAKAETKLEVKIKSDKDTKQTKRRGKNNDK